MKNLISLYLCLHFSVHATCQPPVSSRPPAAELTNPSVKSLTVEDGLPQGFINGLVQDNQGFIWMGTREGLARYDGKSIKVYRSDPKDSTTLAANVLTTIYADRENNIWIIYENNEVDILNPFTEKIRHISKEPAFSWMHKNYIGLPARFVEDSRHGFWIISDDGKLRRFSLKQPSPQSISLPDDEYAYSIKEDKGIIWLLTDKALYNFEDVSPRKLSTLPKPFNTSKADFYGEIGTIIRDIHDDWIIGGKGYVQVYNEKKNSWQLINTGTRVNRFFTASKDGTIYFNSAYSLCRLNPDHSMSVVWENYPGGFISMITDRSDVLWIGTNTYGAKLVNLTSRGFHSFPYQYGFLNDVLHQLLHIPVDEAGWRAYDAYTIRTAIDKEKKLWGISLPDSVIDGKRCVLRDFTFLTQLTNGRATVIPFETNAGDIRVIETLAFDYQNNCWATKYTNELSRVDITAKKIIPVLSLPLFGHTFVHTPAYLAPFGKKLCIVFSNAVEVYDIPTGKATVYKENEVFKNTNLLMAAADPENIDVVWLASMGNGLIRFDTKTGTAKTFAEKEGIPSNTVYAIIADKHGFLWCSSNNGIFRFNPKDNSLLSFTAKDGLQDNEFNRYHFVELPDGHFIFGGTKGWTVFHPDSINIDHFHPPVALTEILVNNTPLNQLPGWKDSAVPALRSIVLPYNQNFITFYFSGLQYNEPGILQYQYKMEGIDKDWVKSGNRNMANYTSLPNGSYTFKINCTNTSGVWNDRIKTFQVVILPPWWETWWARLLFGVLVFALAIAFYRNRINAIRSRQEVLLKQKEAEQLRSLDQMKSRFFSNITHEFRTPLSLIVAPLEELNKDAGASLPVKNKLSLIQRNAQQLTRLINQLLDMSKLEAGNMKTSLSRGELKLFMIHCVKSFEPLAGLKQIGLHYEEENAEGEFLFDADKLEKIVFNLLSNAIKFTPEGGSVMVQFNVFTDSEGMHKMQLKVSDTGIGIHADKLPKIFNRFYQIDETSTRAAEGTGIGLALAKELVELMGGTILAESLPGTGTTFRVSLPVQIASDQQIPLWKHDLSIHGSINGSLIEKEQPLPFVSKESALILIVEDNKDLSAFIAGTLQTNYKVLTAENGVEGLKLAHEELPDIIISDLMMPEMDGYDLCKLIKSNAKTSHIAFIILTAKASHDSVIEGLMLSANDYLTKPFHVDELLLRIRNILSHQEKLRAYHNAQLTIPDVAINHQTQENIFLQQLYSFIEENIDDVGLSVEKLATKMNVSVRTLNRKLNVLAGLSANGVIKQYRLKRAAALLKSGHKISDIAYQVGFDTPSYFTVSFKAFYGLTPSQYANTTT